MEPGFVVAERFEIERRVSAGGMSAVFRAIDRQSGGVVAVKILYGRDEGEHRERLYREARVLEKLSHPGIVRYVAHGEIDGDKPYLAMEWITGETLGKRLARTGLTMGESVRMVTRIAETLATAHAKGIIHRDIKPGNLILRESNVDDPTLIDFGIARMGLGASSITNTGVMLGTLGYMAPEQARGTKQLDARADVFALGAVLFKCLTGLPAFAGEDEIAILAKMLFETPPRVRDLKKDVPEALEEIIGRMLSRDPLQRPADGGIVAAELAALGALDVVGSYSARATSTHGDVITRGEQRLVSVVAVAAGAYIDSEESTINDGQWQGLKSLSTTLRSAIVPFGAHLEALASGMIVVTLPGRHSATDQATRAARCVLAMRAAAPHAPMVLATGRAVIADRVPIGDAIDRAVRMLQQHENDDAESGVTNNRKLPIHVDEVTAGLLDTRFITRAASDGSGLELVGEQAPVDAGRMLLGKPTPCVGREREIVMLEGVFAECVADDVARAVLVTAPAGVGKSRLRYELLRTLRHRGAPHEVWTSRGDPMRAGSPFGMLSQIIRAAADAQDGEPPRVQREKIRARVARTVPQRDLVRVTQFLAETLGISMPEEDDVQLRAARHDPVLMGDQMRRAFEDWLAAETRAQPVLIVLEDLHWGDLPSVKFVDSALRALHDRPLMVLTLARPEVKDLFPDLFAERGVQEMRLKELSKKASEKLVRQVLGEQLSDDQVSQIVQSAGGNAFYLEELIRSHSVGVGIDRDVPPISAHAGRRSILPVVVPETVLTMVQARLEALEPEARRVLRAASVFGQTFWRGGVVALLAGANADAVPPGMRPSAGENEGAQVGAWLDELAVREIVTRRESTKFKGELEYHFRHAFVAEAAYSMLTDKDRVLGHKLAAHWLEKNGESEAVVLAEHLERGGEPKRAITFYRRAAAQALEGNDLEACLARADRGVACGAEGEVLGRLLLRKSEAHRWRGENQKGMECAQRALELLPRSGRRWFLAAGEAVEAAARLGDESELHRSVDELCDVSSAGTLTAPHLVALTRAACVLMAAGNYPSADDLLRTIDAAYENTRRGGAPDDPLAAAHVYRTRAYRALVSGDTGSALSMFNVAIANYEQAGDTRAACRHLVSAAAACIELGSYREAERALVDALASAQHMGLSGVSASVWHHQGMLQARLGDARAALGLADSAIEAFVAQGDRRMEAAARLYRGYFLTLADDLDRAEREVSLALDTAGASPPLHAYGLAILASVFLQYGRADKADACAREALTLLDSLGGVEEGEAFIRLTYAEAREAAGDMSGAREAIATARVRILERTAMIQDAAWKDTFVQQVRENVRTLELYRAWRV
ncbi:MAG: protein kinase [Labilithrix sp.]|nr:protein kinase [Labilithrix sp.]MCW5816218.1 protein kinase [Labilithrix sp.]